MQQVALLQAAGALSASQGRVMLRSYGMTEAQTEQSMCDKLCSHYLTN